ncbi:DNA damage-induced apoptosis suppressor protein [Molossus molossus]|uniref:DNA damage-induced apoptosis suppressor protein n=2 Tax=Molossus molossus TaxID=27622 RepID=A0A7J8EQ14_MOLMO|nr:DNA damage-induced apoptosis suppressor protein [Molossus molossus]XP_036114394.1 DNA damage-induced apoptosis suppressor protein [Molossus molossus]KAF6437395.1 DNA damage induced apoptosis suppressor [Molossus molossus]
MNICQQRPQCEHMNRRRKFLLASVLALQNSSFIYPSCQKCFSRIIFVSKRSNCPKCGSTGESENASYRYKLSIKVAESNKLFGITVFGSCLDAFFGLTATDLHRYMQDPKEIPATLDSHATQNLLTKAVETCFVGQRFIFGVTNFENQHGQGSDSNNFLEQCPGHRREIKELVACQIILPDPDVAGFTVIDYFRQLLRSSDFRKHHGNSQTPNSHLLALEHSGGDLSSICGIDSSSCLFESHGRGNFLIFWQPSLELNSIVSQLTDDNDFSASEQSKAVDTLHPNRKSISLAEATGSSGYHDAVQCSWSLVSYMDKKSTAQKVGEELDFPANQPSIVHSSHHELGVTDSNSFPLEMEEPCEPSNTKSFHSAVEIKKRYSQCELTYHQHHDVNNPLSLQERSTCCPPTLLQPEEIAGGPQNYDPNIWDDLPLSESLNAFMAVIESEIAITQTDASSRKRHLGDGIDKLHADHNSVSVTPQRPNGALHTPLIALRSSQAIVKANSGKGSFLSNREANPTPSVQKESKPDNTAEAVSISRNERDMFECFLSNAYSSALLPSSKSLGTTPTLRRSTRIPPRRAAILHMHNTSESDHSCLNIKCFNGCGQKSLLEMSEKLTTLCSRRYNDVSGLGNLENKQDGRWPKNQGDSLTICRKLNYSLEALCSSPNRSTNTLEKMPYRHTNLTQNNFPGHEGSYNASADLFDDSPKEMDMATETTKKSQDILLQWGKPLAESHHIESDFSLRSPSENSRQSSQKVFLQNMSASMYPKTRSSPHISSDLESDFEDSQDFVPCSQSTPIAGFHQTRIHGMKGAFKKLPAFYSALDTNYKKARISSENEAQQATPRCLKNIKPPSQKSPVMPAITQPEVFNSYPVAECLESDIDEWVPPSTKKAFLSDVLGSQAMGLRKCLAACNSNQNVLRRKKLKHVKQRTNKPLIKKELHLQNTLTAVVTNQKTPNCNSTRSGWISKDSVGSCPEVRCCLSFSENWPPSVPETQSAWSPELFS